MSDSTDREKEIFNQALEMPSAEARNAFLQGACGLNRELRNQIEALLRAYGSAAGFIPDKGPEGTIRVAAGPSEHPGTVIGRYKLLQQIGEGGMGVVYMAEQTEPVVRKVALKIIKLGMDTRNVIARFEAERQALALMDHPNIAKVLDAGATDSGRPYFVMELVRGVPITEYCDKNKLSTKERLDLFIPVCQAIQHAHQKGIIHRDIKPSNVMVTLHDGKPVPRVIDFGIAKATNQRLTEKTLFTNYAQMIGTPAYMSPEQAEMSGLDVDTRTDVYSLGVLLYELLTGTTPFPSKELLSLGYGEMQRVIAEIEPPKPSTRLSTMEKAERTVVARNRSIEISALAKVFKGDLDWIVMKAIEKDRSHRYDTVTGLATDVQRHLRTEPVIARPASAAYRLQKLVRRNKLAFAASAAIAVALLAGAALSTWQAVRATRAERLQSILREQAQLDEQKARQAQANERKDRQNAENARTDEAAQRRKAEAQAYASDINLVQQALTANNLGRAREVLDRHRPQPGQKDLRGWEWRWLWSQCRGDASSELLHGTNAIFALAPSPDGKLLAFQEGFGPASVVVMDISDLSAPREMARFTHGKNPAFSSSGGLLAYSITTNIMGTNLQSHIHLWNPETRTESTDIFCDGRCQGLVFSADGHRLVAWTAKSTDGKFNDQVVLWQLPEGKMIAAYPVAHSFFDGEAFAVSPDLGLAAIPGDSLQIIDLSTGKERWSVMDSNVYFGDAAFSPDGKILAVAYGRPRTDASIRLYDAASGKELCAPLKDHRVVVSGLVFWPDGKTLASSSFDQTIRLWDVSDPAHVQPRGKPLRGHTSSITALALLPNSQTLVSGSWGGSVLAFNTAEMRNRKTFVTLPDVRRWQFAADSNSLITIDQMGQVAEWQGNEFETKLPLFEIDKKAGPTKISEDSRLLAVGLTNGDVELYNVAKHTLLRRFGHYTERVTDVAFLPGSTNLWVWTFGPPIMLHLWDLISFQEIQSWKDLNGPSCTSPDGRWYFTCGYDGACLLLDITSSREQDSTLQIQDPRGSSISPDGKFVAVASQLGYVRLWDLATLRPAATLGSFLIGAHSVAFSPDGTRLMAGGDGDEAIKIWDVDSRQELLTLEAPTDVFWTPKFSPDGNTLGSLQQYGLLHLWRAPSWAEIAAAEAKEKTETKQP
jgi:eukaryotic-like serine/threonine-protein kinase